jgi:short-subunit dehydrogenase
MARGTALVTGASRGIGRAVSEALAARGWDVIGTCRAPGALRQEDRLDGVRYLPLDLANEKSIEALLAEVGSVDLLVNNAGESPIGPAEELPGEKLRGHFQVNFFGPVRLTQGLLPAMREKKSGTVIFIGSIRSEVATPFSSIYSASKAATRSFGESLRMEVRDHGVRVAVVAPWHVRTTLQQEMLARPGSPYRDALARVKKNRDESIAAAPGPEKVAAVIIGLVESANPAPFTVVGKPLLTFLLRHLPRRLVAAATARMVGM